MLTKWLSIPTFLAVLLGFAGVLGTQLYYLRAKLNSRQVAAALALSGLVMLPPLSLPILPQWIGWFAAFLVVVLFTLRPIILPSELWSLRFALGYNSLTMVLVALWGIASGFSSRPWIYLGGFAILAAFLSWHRRQNIPT